MFKIMFVCHGNICRSPMAEFVALDLVRKQGRENEFLIRSAAVSSEEICGDIGNPVYPPVKDLLSKYGIDCRAKRATLLMPGDADCYDLFVCMDDGNVRRAVNILGSAYAHKCVKLLSFCDESGDVSDPWYTRDFKACYRDVLRGVTAMLARLRSAH